MEPRTLKGFEFRPIYHIIVKSLSGKEVVESSRALAREHIKYTGTNYDFTSTSESQRPTPDSPPPHSYLFRDLEEALVAKQTLELLVDVERAQLTKFDGLEAVRAPFTMEELETIGQYGFPPHNSELTEI